MLNVYMCCEGEDHILAQMRYKSEYSGCRNLMLKLSDLYLKMKET